MGLLPALIPVLYFSSKIHHSVKNHDNSLFSSASVRKTQVTRHFLPERFTRPVPPGFAKLFGFTTDGDVAQTHETMDSWEDDEF